MHQDSTPTPWMPTAFAGEASLRFETDRVELRAGLRGGSLAVGARRPMALQLWADDSLLLAELPLGALQPDARGLARISASLPLRPPAGQSKRRLSLSLVSGRPGTWDRLHDRQRFAIPQRFLQPALEGAVQARLEGGTLQLGIEAIVNPRDAADISGRLALELWALEQPYAGGDFRGQPLGSTLLGSLGGQQRRNRLNPAWCLPETPPASPARTHLTLMLREWTQSAYVTRDWRALDWPQPSGAAAPSINRSTTARLRSVPGISDKLARTIVASRPFASLDELQRVRGMNARLYARLRDRVLL
ncbi:helix-hairpin-helix domain-containing protein [Malikia sp.]|uniref:ComEA family DNA-binding protein n=1 Tax=Malikia sp. TaxID=2070706 RepID=UPI002628A46F|nr:helix-hairpin-helix domain-containing protein [Malikia sp.]MDD2728696.1 helix-hairpin-helix domain-containing protein [Malikia sp.]